MIKKVPLENAYLYLLVHIVGEYILSQFSDRAYFIQIRYICVIPQNVFVIPTLRSMGIVYVIILTK